jgi:hypothetical protein
MKMKVIIHFDVEKLFCSSIILWVRPVRVGEPKTPQVMKQTNFIWTKCFSAMTKQK